MDPRTKACTNIVMWNANGIQKKTDELLHLMESRNVCVALISETHLQPHNKMNLANHAVYRTDRQTSRGGGTAIIVKTNAKHHEIALPAVKSIEATGIQLQTATGPVRLIAAYSPPSMKIANSDIDALLDSNIPTILGGDLNAKHQSWNSRTANAKGRSLLNHCKKSDFIVAGPTEPTHYHYAPNHQPDVLDVIILKNFRHSVELETVAALTSDHNPVMVKIGDETETHQKTPRYNFRKADWQRYQEELNRIGEPGPLSTAKEIDEAVDHFTEAIQKAMENSVPKQTPPRCSIYDLPEGIKQSIAEKNRARRQWQKHRTPDLLKRYNTLTRLLKEQIQRHRGEKWETAVSNLKEADNSIWRMTRRLTGKKEASPPIQGRTHLACTNKDKAEVLADALEESFTPNAASAQSNRIKQEVARHLASHPSHAEEDHAVECTEEEVTKQIKSLTNGKAPGQDGIMNQAIKMLPPPAVNHLTKIFNACLRLQHFPKTWKEAKVIVFPKPGKPLKDPTNYRPISLLSGLSKLLEKLILARLTEHTTARNLLQNEQFGFRKEHSTTHQLLRVVDTISHGFNIHKATGIVFLDVSKAFDRVWHTGLLHKLTTMDFPNYLVNLLSSYLEDRTFHVSVREERSSSRPIRAGVPQGSIIGPFLFNLFTNDIPKDLKKVELALYADDVAVISQSFKEKEVAKNLQSGLDKLSGWYDDWQMGLNSTKTTATMFTRKASKVHPEIRLKGEVIKWEPTSNYLGVTLDSKNNWKSHVEKTQQKTSGKLAALYPLLKTKTMPLKSKVKIIKAIIRPTMTYAAPVWSGCHPAYREMLQKVQNKALRTATGAPPWTRTADLHRDLGIEMLDDHLLKLSQNFYSQLDQNTNPLIKKLATISANPFDRYPRPITALHL